MPDSRVRISSPVPINSCQRASTSPRSSAAVAEFLGRPARERGRSRRRRRRLRSHAARSCACTASASAAAADAAGCAPRRSRVVRIDRGAGAGVGGQRGDPVPDGRDGRVGQPALLQCQLPAPTSSGACGSPPASSRSAGGCRPRRALRPAPGRGRRRGRSPGRGRSATGPTAPRRRSGPRWSRTATGRPPPAAGRPAPGSLATTESMSGASSNASPADTAAVLTEPQRAAAVVGAGTGRCAR